MNKNHDSQGRFAAGSGGTHSTSKRSGGSSTTKSVTAAEKVISPTEFKHLAPGDVINIAANPKYPLNMENRPETFTRSATGFQNSATRSKISVRDVQAISAGRVTTAWRPKQR